MPNTPIPSSPIQVADTSDAPSEFIEIGGRARVGDTLLVAPQTYIILINACRRRAGIVRRVGLVDRDDFDRLGHFKWSSLVSDKSANVPIYYAIRSDTSGEKPKGVLLHRLIMDAPKGIDVDHINGNGLDNRRENLRLCRPWQNQGNRRKRYGDRSKYKGVRRHALTWSAEVRARGGRLVSGGHASEESAARAYDELAKVAFGEFACLNFPEEEAG